MPTRFVLVFLLGAVTFAQPKPDFFSNLSLLCTALSSEGLKTSGWKSFDGGEHQCITSYIDIGGRGSVNPPTNIAYYVGGNSPTRANEISIVLNVNDRTTASAGRLKLTSATRVLFEKLSVAPPPGLLAAVAAGKPFSASQPYGTVAHQVDKSKIDTFKVAIRAK